MINLNEIINEPNPYVRFANKVESAKTEEEKQKILDEYVVDLDHEGFVKTFLDLIKDTNGRSFNELIKYRSNVPKLLSYIDALEKRYAMAMYLYSGLMADRTNANKKWSKEDDNVLIETVCEGVPINIISSQLRRTESAIIQRISYLVGAKRLSQNIAGKFIGIADGKKVEQELVGTLYRK